MISSHTLNRMMQIDESTIRYVEETGTYGSYIGSVSGMVYCAVRIDDTEPLVAVEAEIVITDTTVGFLGQSRADCFRYLEELLQKEFAIKRIIRNTD